eukprot:scaffold832_cov256-Skeletonema_marinoi.AAC.6
MFVHVAAAARDRYLMTRPHPSLMWILIFLKILALHPHHPLDLPHQPTVPIPNTNEQGRYHRIGIGYHHSYTPPSSNFQPTSSYLAMIRSLLSRAAVKIFMPGRNSGAIFHQQAKDDGPDDGCAVQMESNWAE